ncbi:hypothetical protein ABT362_38035 [Nonomuraea rubra]|uniref:hypothetical protein n=1 Tax=Nonomuraea rubra TaxID=46180 RepID=UPI003317DBDD
MIVAGSIALGGSAQASAMTAQVGFAGQAGFSGQAGISERVGLSEQVGLSGRVGSSGQITSPSDGEVISSSSVVVSARTGLMQLRMGLYVDGPSTPSQKVASGGANQTLSGTFDAGDAPNGTFTVTLKGEITGSRYASTTFKLRRPAEAPGGVNASRQGTDKVLVTWNKGSEPDLQSYEVSNTQSGVVGRLSADSACAGSSCKAVLAVPSKAAGQKVGFSVKAFRGDGDGGSIGSGDSAAAYVTFPAPPAAQPTRKATDSAQAPKNRDARGVDALPTLPAKKQAIPSRKPTTPTRKPTTTKLPDIPDADPSGNLPIPSAVDQGENDGLVPADTKDGADEAPVQSDGVKAQSSESPIGNIGQYGLYVAGGILLLLLGAHAGAWARRRALATGSSGSARLTPAPDTDAPTGAAQAHNTNPGLHVRQPETGTPHTTAAPRRPAVILAVAKTRLPEQPSRPQQVPGMDAERSLDTPSKQSDGEGRSLSEARGRRSEAGMDAGGAEPLLPASAVESSPTSPLASSAPRASALSVELPLRAATAKPPYGAAPRRREVSPSDRRRGEASTSDRGQGEVPRPDRGRRDVPGSDRERGEVPRSDREREEVLASDQVVADRMGGGAVTPDWTRRSGAGGRRSGAGGPLPHVADGDDSGGVQGRQKEWGAQQAPLQIALPSSAVTDVPEPAAPAVAPAVRLEERWDDYLPPSPRSMEDSGFWERPQPGAADFWAADEDADDRGDEKGEERTQAGRRHRDGWS